MEMMKVYAGKGQRQQSKTSLPAVKLARNLRKDAFEQPRAGERLPHARPSTAGSRLMSCRLKHAPVLLLLVLCSSAA